MRFTSAAAFLAVAGGHVLAFSPIDCLVENGQELASLADCGHQGVISECLTQLKKFDPSSIKACYASGGCSGSQANNEYGVILSRCQEKKDAGDLRKRFQGVPMIPRVDADVTGLAARADSTADSATTSQTGSVKSGDACFTTSTKATSDCPVTTNSAGKSSTGDCTSTDATVSKCAATMICTVDSSNNDICMVRKDLDVTGIIIAIIFAGSLVVGFGAIIFMSCKDKKEQKRLTAKAEAVSLARAATKKQRAQQREPLMRGPSQTSGAGDPFQDQEGRTA